jgi:hypothetical protein
MANLTLRSTKGSPLTHAELDGNFEYLTGSINAISDATGSFLTGADTGSFLTGADTGSFVTTAQTASFVTAAQTASLNISDTLYTVNTALSASVTSSATTSVCIYGVNVFEHVTPTNHATKLPQPVTGKSVRVVNNGNTLLKIFPSNVGGRINNYPVDTPAVIPPDGNLYEFICVENPLPGEWTFSAPATGQYDSGDIEISVTSGVAVDEDAFNPVVVAYDANNVGSVDRFNGSNWGYNGKNKPTVIKPTDFVMGEYNGFSYLAFRPDTAWKGIAKIKVYTNLINTPETQETYVYLNAGGQADQYSLAEGKFISTNLDYSWDHTSLFVFGLPNVIAGTPTTGSTQYTSTNIGDPGTLWAERVAYSGVSTNVSLGSNVGTTIGNKSLNNAFPYPYATGSYEDANGDYTEIYQGDPCELFYSSYISFQIQPFAYDFDYGTVPDFKFRFIIEYY